MKTTRSDCALALVLCLACSGRETRPPVPSSIEILASADSLYHVDADPTVQLTAIVRDDEGREYADGSVDWTADGLTIRVGSSRTATLRWPDVSAPTTAFTVDVVARFGGLEAHKQIRTCAADSVVAKTSGAVLRGRSLGLEAVVFAYPLQGPGLAMDIPVQWATSNAAVLSVHDVAAIAENEGIAMLTVSACGQSDTVSVAVVAAGYSVIPIQPSSATSSDGVALNDDGKVVGTSSAASYRNFLWDGSAFVDLADCQPKEINARSQVLCSGGGPTIWESGSASVRDTLATPAAFMNDSSWVVGSAGGSVYVWTAPGSHSRFTMPFGSGASLRDMNNTGDLVGVMQTTYDIPLFVRAGSVRSLAINGRFGAALAINDSGDAVGFDAGTPSGIADRSGALLWRAANQWQIERLRPANDVAQSASDINNAREIIGRGTRGTFIWSKGRLTLLSSVLSDPDWTITAVRRINEGGQILAQGQNSKTGYSGAVLLQPANP